MPGRRPLIGPRMLISMNELLARHPLPSAKIFHGYAAASEISLVKNRMREICTSGSVVDEFLEDAAMAEERSARLATIKQLLVAAQLGIA